MEDVRILIGLLDDVNVDTSASRPRRIELNASIWSLTSQFGSPSQSTVDLRNELASHPELASELAKGLFQLASESVPHTPDTGTSSTKKLDATQEQIESSTFALRLARNVAAGHAELQHIFWQHVESIDPLLSFVTAFVQVHDEIYRPLTRAAVQMLSNLLMANAEVQHAFWTRYVLDGSRELGRTQLLLRLLASSDHGTLVASLLVLLTCCRGSTQNRHLVTVPECRALLELLFSVLEQSFRDYAEAEREPSSNPIEELDELSSMTYSLFSHLFSERLFGSILQTISPSSSALQEPAVSSVASNPVTGAQRTLLGLYDAYLSAGAEGYGASSSSSTQVPDQFVDASALIRFFIQLGTHLHRAMVQLPRPSNGSGGVASPPPSFDARTLIGVPQAIVLTIQCINEWILTSTKSSSLEEDGDESRSVVMVENGRFLLTNIQRRAKVSLDAHFPAPEADMVLEPPALRPDDPIGIAICLLREISAIFPAESPFKASNQDSTSGTPDRDPSSMPDGHVLSHTGSSSLRNGQSTEAASLLDEGAGGPGKLAFTFLKRELVRLVGIVSFAEARTATDEEKTAVRGVQDYVRQLGGLFTVLGMTQLDELNPYIREHAVFALRNLLSGNQANQDLIAQLRRVDDPAAK